MKHQKIIPIISAVLATIGLAIFFVVAKTKPTREEISPQMLLDAEYETRGDLEEYQEKLAKKHPIILSTPYISEKFEIYYGVEDFKKMKIFLSVIIKPSDDNSESEVESIVNEVNGWIKSHGEDPDDILIEWSTE